jgi:hypothetical protein
VSRPISTRLAVALFSAFSFSTLPALAQSGAPASRAAAPTKPATEQDVFLYTQMALVSTCNLVINGKVPLDKAIPANVKMVVSVITGLHGSSIAGIGSGKLTEEQLASGVYVSLLKRLKQSCYDNMGPTDKAMIDKDFASIEKAEKANTKK